MTEHTDQTERLRRLLVATEVVTPKEATELSEVEVRELSRSMVVRHAALAEAGRRLGRAFHADADTLIRVARRALGDTDR